MASQLLGRYRIWTGCGLGILLFQACSSPSIQSESTHRNRQNKSETYSESHEDDSAREDSQKSDSARETADFQEIQALYTKNLFESTEEKVKAFTRRYPRGNLLPGVENIYGLLLLDRKRPDLALYHFQRALQLNSNPVSFQAYIRYNLATAQFEMLQIDEAQQTLNEIPVSTLDKSNQLKVSFLRASIYQKKSLPLEAARQLLSAGYLIPTLETAENKKSFYRLLDQALQAITEIGSLETLFREFEDSPVADSLLFRLGSQNMAVGNHGNGEIHLKALTQKFPDSAYYQPASELLAHAQDQAEVDSRTVGVLLPMKGKFAKFGAKSLQGIQLAFGVFDTSQPDSKMNIIVEDSGDEADQAIKSLNRLVFKHHVVAVIGPMLSKGIDQISQRAQELGVPLISLSRRAGPVQDYVFQAGLTQQLQAYEIARYAVQHLGAKKFALISPNEKFGLEISQNFWDAVESLGGKIVGSESYNPNETDFRQVIDKLSGLYYSEARQRELDLLSQERDANHITKKTRKTEQFYHLKPIVDYDAVFIPDEPKVAGQILPTFDYRDVGHVHFLGISNWNSPDFISRSQSYGEHATFVDAYFSESKSPAVRNFSNRFKAVFGQEPSSFEALAYDAASLVRSLLTASSANTSRTDLRDRLKEVKDFQGITGKLTYKEGQFFRDLQALTIRNGKFIEAP